MGLIVLILFMIYFYHVAKFGFCIADWLVPGLGFSDEKFIEKQILLDNWDHLAKGFLVNEFLIANHINIVIDFFNYYYYKTNPSVYSDIYYYFRYDFLKWNHFAAIKFLAFCGVLFLPVAIYESYEYGFPKEYLYVIPAVFYSSFLTYFAAMYFEVTINFVENSWFLNAYYDIPEIELWLEYMYINKNESYIGNKIKQFYYFLFVIESIDVPEIQIWEDFVYFDEDNRKSLIIIFYKKYLWWLTPRPKKIKWPKWR